MGDLQSSRDLLALGVGQLLSMSEGTGVLQLANVSELLSIAELVRFHVSSMEGDCGPLSSSPAPGVGQSLFISEGSGVLQSAPFLELVDTTSLVFLHPS